MKLEREYVLEYFNMLQNFPLKCCLLRRDKKQLT